MENTFLATAQTWWITGGDYPKAGLLEKGESLISFEEILTFNNKFKWESSKKDYPGIITIEKK